MPRGRAARRRARREALSRHRRPRTPARRSAAGALRGPAARPRALRRDGGDRRTDGGPMSDVSAKQVAKELDKRMRRRKLTWLGVWATLITLAVLYLRCGQGWGLGGAGEGEGGSGASKRPNTTTSEKRCQLRIGANGITVDGKGANRATAVEACKQLGRAELYVAGDARHGDVLALQASLTAANIDTLLHDASHH